MLAKVAIIGPVWAVGAGLAWGVGWFDGVHGSLLIRVDSAAGVAVDKCLSRGAVGEFLRKREFHPTFHS